MGSNIKGSGKKAVSLQHSLKRRTPTARDRSTNITTVVEEIGAELALEYLELKDINRSIIQSSVDQFARDMLTGNWRFTHQGIGFDWFGKLYDGEHRLWAVVQANEEASQKGRPPVTFKTLVTRGLDPDSRDGVDQGKNRTVKHVLEIKLGGVKLKGVGVAIARKLMDPGVKPTRREQEEAFLLHADAINAITDMIPKKLAKFGHASLLAPMVRAWYQPAYRERVKRFMEVMVSGQPNDGDEVIILLRNFLLFAPSLSGDKVRNEIYSKTERALYAYVKDERLTKLYTAKEELFPLPMRKG